MKSYTFRCMDAGGGEPAIHLDTCADDDQARLRARTLLDLWPLAERVNVTLGERHFEVHRPA